MRRGFSLITLIIFVVCLTGLLAFVGAKDTQAQIDGFTYFIPYPSDLFDNILDIGSNNNFQNREIRTVISMVAASDGTLIYYDHWEDGLELNLTTPAQPTSEVWGDNNPANGMPPGFVNDLINQGTVINLDNVIPQPNPRSTDPNNPIYDGGDKLIAVGGNIAVSLANWPDDDPPNPGTGGNRYAGSWELYPTDRWGSVYVSPIGQDLVGAGPNQREGFEVVLASVQAALDGTAVTFDLDADGVPDDFDGDLNPDPPIILNQGEMFTQLLTGTVNVGGRITTPAGFPVQVHLFASDADQTYESRAYSLIPFTSWTNDYIGPRSADGDFWIHNPDPINDLTLNIFTVTDPAGTTVFNVPAGTTAKYPPVGLQANPTGIRFLSSGAPFYAVAALDPDSARDWGYALFPFASLTTQKIIGWAPGNSNPPPLPGPGGTGIESQIYLTAGQPTTVTVEFNNTPPAPPLIVNVTPYTQAAIVDANDFDLSGALLYTVDGTPFGIVWGQDPSATPGSPSLDLGTAIVPLPSISLQKALELIVDADNTGTPTWGDTVRFTIVVVNNSRLVINPARVSDQLPPVITYVPNTAQIDGVDIVPGDPFPLDPGYDFVLGALDQRAITFDAIINEGAGAVANTASVSAPGNPSIPPAAGAVGFPIKVADYEFDKRLISPANGMANRGDVITYGITITSTGNISITRLPLRDVFDQNQLTFISSQPPPDASVPGETTWNDLTTFFGPLNPQQTIHVTVTARVNNVPPGAVTIQNTASVEGAQGADGAPLPPQQDTAEVMVPPLVASYVFDKRLINPADGLSNSGRFITFGLTITNTGNLSLTAITLRDTVDPTHLTFLNSTPPPDSTSPPGTIIWNNLVAIFGPLLPDQTINLTTTYQVNPQLSPNVANTSNVATVDGVQDSLGNDLPPMTDTEMVSFPPPVPAPSTDQESSDDDDDEEVPPRPGAPGPPPTPTLSPAVSAPTVPPGVTPPPVPAPGATPTLPVTFLPETGLRGGSNGLTPLGGLLLIVVSLTAFLIWSKTRRE